MKVQVYSQPCILLETVELLYAYVNGVSPQNLTADGPYCIPEEEMRAILEEACRGMDPTGPELRRYFLREGLKDGSGDYTCLARSLAYMNMDLSGADLPSAIASLRQYWRDLRSAGEYPVRIGRYSLDCSRRADGRQLSLAESVGELPVSRGFQQSLLAALEDFEAATGRLAALTAPAAERLSPLLAPWAQRAAPLLDHWREQFSRPAWFEAQKRRWYQGLLRQYDTLSFALRYLDPRYQLSQFDDVENSLSLHIGVNRSVSPAREAGFESWQLRVLRLLGSPVRTKLLLTIRATPMSTRELAQAMEMDLGTVSRDIRNMYDAGLLVMEESGGRRRYAICNDTMDALIAHLENLKAI